METLTLLKANIRYKKGSFICVLLLTFIISLCLTTIVSMNYNIGKRAEASLEMNDIGDLIPIISDFKCPDTILQSLKDNENVDHIRIMRTITQKLEINNIVNGSSTFFASYNQEQLSYKIYTNSGLSFQKNPAKLKQGEIYVPISFERLYNSKIGDKAYLTTGVGIKSLTIKGYFEEPFLGAEMIGIKLALMNEDDFNLLNTGRIQTKEEREKDNKGILGYYFVNIYQAKESSLTMSNLKRLINDDSGIIGYSLFTLSTDQSISFTLMFTQIISGIMLAFLILLFIVVLIVMGHSISTGIEMDYTNLGVLKALGFSKGKLRKVFVFEYILAELLGSALGIVLSIPAIYYLNIIFVRMAGLLSAVNPAFGICLAILTAILLLSALFIFMKTRSIIKVSPVRAISGGRDNIYFHSKCEIPIEGKRLYFRMALRQLTSNSKQYISSIIIVAILIYFLISITVINTGIDQNKIAESFGIASSDLYVGYNPGNDKSQEEINKLQKEVEADISGLCPIENAFMLGSRYFTVNGDEYHTSIYTDPTIIKSVLKGRVPRYDNEIIVTKIVAKDLGVHMGDTVIIGNEKLEKEYIICGYFQCTSDLGRTISMSSEGAKRIIPDYNMTYMDYVLTDSSKSTEVVNMIKDKYRSKIDTKDMNAQNDFGDTIINSMSVINVVVYTISIMFALVVIVIVCSKVFLKERTDYGIYKALGFSSGSLRLQFALRFAIVAFIGSLLGVIMNLCLNNAMMSALLSNIGISNFPTTYTLSSIIMPIAVLTLCFFVFAYLVSRRIKRVDTRSLISDN